MNCHCPVCEKEGESHSYKDDIWGNWQEVESSFGCNNCDFSVSWSYGANYATFGGKQYGWGDDDYDYESYVNTLIAEASPSFTNRHFRYFDYDDDIPF